MIKPACTFLFLIIFLYATPFDETVEYIFPDENPVVSLLAWKMSYGDCCSWRHADYDDRHWEVTPGIGLWNSKGKSGKGVRWYRKTLFFPQSPDSLAMLALYQVAIVSANEIYWDGQLIARNGMPARNIGAEKTGKSGKIFIIPGTLVSPGKHVIAMRVSNFHTSSGIIDTPLQIGYFKSLSKYLFRTQAISAFLAGIFILTALFHFAILLGHGNKWPYALFSTFCLSCAIYIFIRGLIRYFQIDLLHYYTLATLNDIPWFFMMALLPIFFLFEFSSPFKTRLTVFIGTITLLLILLPRMMTYGIIPIQWLNVFDRANQIHIYFTILVSISVSSWALYNRKVGSLSALIGLLLFLVGVIYSNRASVENGWAIGFAMLNIFLTISLSNQMAHRNRLHQESELRNARLEIELLKKHIQPHFLLNSLNSIVAWLEEDPPTASKLVNAFADELRMLLGFSKKKIISLSDEINLCKTHLKVMSLRQEKKYSITVKGLKGTEKLPPLIIHTLVENGLTHGYKEKEKGSFVLTCEHQAKGLRITLFNDSTGDTNERPKEDGTGIQYVKTRLEEAFPSSWRLISEPTEGGWQVIIDIKGAVE